MAFYSRGRRPLAEEEKSTDAAKARTRAMELLARQELSSGQLYERLNRRYTQQTSAAVVAEMVQREYINDARYAETRAHALLAAADERTRLLWLCSPNNPTGNVVLLAASGVAADVDAGAISGASTLEVAQSAGLSNPIPGGSWTSSDTAIATVDATTGKVTAVSPGSVTITYTLPGLCSTPATHNITINAAPITPPAPKAVPSLSEWFVIALSCLLATLGVSLIRRRRC